jgi:hypothetical protein
MKFREWLKLREGVEVSWHKPSLEEERGEIERQSQELNMDAQNLAKIFQSGHLVPLNDDTWNRMENTESSSPDIKLKDVLSWTHRDVNSIHNIFEKGGSLPAPMVLIHNGTPICVAGNTRLSLARALGVRPQVWMAQT